MSDLGQLPHAVRRLLRPLAGILLDHGVPHAAFAEWAKHAYVEEAERRGGVGGRKISASRLSVVTGLTRKDVARIRALPDGSGGEAAARYHRASRVVTAWIREPAYTDGDGCPRALPIEGAEPSFAALVRSFAGDVPHIAMLDELERVGTVERVDDGDVRLLARAYVPRQSEDDKLEILGADVAGLIETISHNLDNEGAAARFQRKVYYDNMPEEALPELKALTAKHSQALLELLDRWMSKHDRDATPNVTGTGRRGAGIGIYYFENDLDDEESQS